MLLHLTKSEAALDGYISVYLSKGIFEESTPILCKQVSSTEYDTFVQAVKENQLVNVVSLDSEKGFFDTYVVIDKTT